jgi:hypothetical protein
LIPFLCDSRWIKLVAASEERQAEAWQEPARNW